MKVQHPGRIYLSLRIFLSNNNNSCQALFLLLLLYTGYSKIGVQTTYYLKEDVHGKNVSDKKINYFRIPPPPGGTAILPEYIHYYG
jgi:hypothetical protein